MSGGMADVLNLTLNIISGGGVVALVVWAVRYARAARRNQSAVVREIGRLRMAERDSTEISRMVHEVRRHLAERPDEWAAGYIAGLKRDPRDGDGRPPLRPVG